MCKTFSYFSILDFAVVFSEAESLLLVVQVSVRAKWSCLPKIVIRISYSFKVPRGNRTDTSAKEKLFTMCRRSKCRIASNSRNLPEFKLNIEVKGERTVFVI